MTTPAYYLGMLASAVPVAVVTLYRVLRDPLARAGLWAWFVGWQPRD